jgi:hypothetical protein
MVVPITVAYNLYSGSSKIQISLQLFHFHVELFLNRNRVLKSSRRRALSPPSSHTTVRTVPYTAVRDR